MPRRKKISKLYRRFSGVVADIMEHPECPHEVYERLGDLANELLNDAGLLNDKSTVEVFLLPSLEEMSFRHRLRAETEARSAQQSDVVH